MHKLTIIQLLSLSTVVLNSSVATGLDDPDYPGQMGCILSGSLGYPDITKITGYPVYRV